MPDKPNIEPCKGCGAMMVWAVTDNDRPMPFDAKPVRMYDLRQDEHGRWRALPRIVYMPHHATCPKADQFRKPKPGAFIDPARVTPTGPDHVTGVRPEEEHEQRRDLD